MLQKGNACVVEPSRSVAILNDMSRVNTWCAALIMVVLVGLPACSTDDGKAPGTVSFELDGEAVEYNGATADEQRANAGDPAVSARIVAPSAGPPEADRIRIDVPLLAPGTWAYSGHEDTTAIAGTYPRIDLTDGGTLYRCYPGLQLEVGAPEAVHCSVSIVERNEQVVGSFSGLLVAVNDALQPTGATARVTDGQFEIPQGSAAARDDDAP